MHEFELELTWSGSTASKDYSRDGAAKPVGKPHSVPVSTGEMFGGNAEFWNPEDLMGAALGNCHMQTFLALASKVGVDVRSYEDRVVTVLDEVDRVTKITRFVLQPTIGISADSDPQKAAKFFEKAHKYCFIGNSTTAEVVMQPTIVVAE